MRRTSFSTLLIGLNAALVLLAVLGMGAAAAGLLRRLADEQALARVSLAAAGALQAVERSAGDARTSAELLAERPTAGRLLAAGDAVGLAAFLERFRDTSHLAGCAVLEGDRVVARSAGPLPWAELARAAGPRPALLWSPAGTPLLAAASPLASAPGAKAIAVLALDAAWVRRVAEEVGLPVRILGAGAALAAADEARFPIVERAVEGGKPASGHLGKDEAYLAVLPVRLAGAAGTAPAALVEATLPNAEVAASLSGLVRRLAVLSLLVAALATLFGLLVGSRLARPVRALTAAAARIGHGDLTTPMPAAPGAELGTLAATMDEMRRRLLRQTAELTRRQAEGEAVLTGIAEGVYSVDRDRRIRYLNPQAAALLGIAPEAALGRFCGDVLKPQSAGGVRPCEEDCPIVHARFRGGARATEQLLAADGRRRAVVITSSPPAEGQQFQVLRDETDTEAARRLRDAVLANVSHEFKTPLSAQLASIELLRERLAAGPADDEIRSLVLALERGSLRLTQLVDNLLESVRIESGQDSIRRRPVALDEVVEEAVEMTAPLVAQRGQRLAVDLPYPLPAVRGDGPRLTQVFVNLLANANKFAPPASTIRVGGAVGGGGVSLWVEDEGPGLPDADGSSLFGRFVRSPGEEEPGESGMGLGLWIVQSIVERHGGSVEARTAGPGTRVSVTLPLAQSSEAA